MSKIIDVRNPPDLTDTYASIELHSASEKGGTYSIVGSAETIDTAYVTDLSAGYTSITDSSGDNDTWYKYRYKTSGGSYSPWSHEFKGDSSFMQARFRANMKDDEEEDYFFSETELREWEKDAINSLWPDTWIEVIDETLSTDGSTEKFNFPIGITRVDDIELINSNNEVAGRPHGWKQRGRQFIFDYAPANGYTFRLYADKRFTKLAEIPSIYDDIILKQMMLSAYRNLEAHKTRYYKYNSIVKEAGGSLPALRLIIRELETFIRRRMLEIKRVRKPASIDMSS